MYSSDEQLSFVGMAQWFPMLGTKKIVPQRLIMLSEVQKTSTKPGLNTDCQTSFHIENNWVKELGCLIHVLRLI